MSSKRAMRQAQKQAYAKHRSNILNNWFELKKKLLIKNKEQKKVKTKSVDQISLFSFILIYKK